MHLYTQVRTRHLLDTKLRQQSARAEGICQVNTHIDLNWSHLFLQFSISIFLNNRQILMITSMLMGLLIASLCYNIIKILNHDNKLLSFIPYALLTQKA